MKTALIMAGGTGGHIFPGLALAHALKAQGWKVHWLGGSGMEQRLVPPQGFAMHTIDFDGVRGKGLLSFAILPAKILRAFWQSIDVIRNLKPDVVIGMGGYITFPAGMMAVLLGKPLVLHEQNSVAGMANKVLAKVADQVLSTFPEVLPRTKWVGNPLRSEFLQQAHPSERFAGRTGALRLLVIGGSLGAKVLNDVIPQALAKLPFDQRPIVTHQGGEKQIEALRANYAAAGVEAKLVPFIENTAEAFAQADLIICRAGASTVSEIAAVGASAIFIPFPFAVDDHQTRNAEFLSFQGAALLIPQTEFTVERIFYLLSKQERIAHIPCAEKAYSLRKIHATECLVEVCEKLTGAKPFKQENNK